DDADLCSELLQESLDALRALPEATLFDEGTVSSVWLEVVERATKFLSDIHGSASTKSNIPLQDEHLALAILLELAVQRGTLSQLLSAVLLLLRLWENGTREMDNERSTQGTSAPLLPLLQRFHNIHSSKEEPVPEEDAEKRVSSSCLAVVLFTPRTTRAQHWYVLAGITADGELYTWGRGNYGRLGHGFPVYLHPLYFVSTGQVWSWGDGDYGKLGRGGSDGCKTPKLVEKLQDLDIVKSFAWSSCSEWSVGQRVPFVVDVCSMTFEQLDLLLRQVSEDMDGSSDWPPPQEKECMVVATLNLLRLQVRNIMSTDEPTHLFC
ncbi:hypothetical protein XENOCAPTIV_024721, partial [Xenoophorus captivus]